MSGISARKISFEEAATLIESSSLSEVSLDLGVVSFVRCSNKLLGDFMVATTATGGSAVIK